MISKVLTCVSPSFWRTAWNESMLQARKEHIKHPTAVVFRWVVGASLLMHLSAFYGKHSFHVYARKAAMDKAGAEFDAHHGSH